MSLAKFHQLLVFTVLLTNIRNLYIKEIFQQVLVLAKYVRMLGKEIKRLKDIKGLPT